ncbi:MAG: hypothetical protein LBU50_00010 [Cellulomonas sp.]|jgi:hypothetical protein|nr:hypothetical protein [Cellulomonas sp.]
MKRNPVLVRTALVVVAVLALLVQTSARPTDAQAADLTGFRPGLIISDAVFFDSTTMTAAQIDAFLDTKGAACQPGEMPCLKDYRQTTTTKAPDTNCPGGYAGAANESAGTIIAKVARACGINPQVLLVNLQKEQGLVTITKPTLSRYNKAMGFACPDSTGCDVTYYGFFTQVYKGAWQLQNYTHNPTRYGYRAGVTNQILYHPNTACGKKSVYIENQATANLYIYTPYVPNDAALAAGYGTGNSCSSYGNRNFYSYFTDWFGSTTANRLPVGQVEMVEATAGQIVVDGWAYDPDGSSPVQVAVSVDGAATNLTASAQRTVPGRSGPVGFTTTIKASTGEHAVCVSAKDTQTDRSTSLGCWTVSVAPTVSPSSGTGLVVGSTTRVLDTWTSNIGGATRCFSVQSAGVPAAATGVLLNVTTVAPTAPGNVVLYAEGSARPSSSNVNFEVGRDVAAATWVSLGADARLCLAGQGGAAVRVVVDVSGYTTSSAPVVTQVPTRLMDTRSTSRVGTQGSIPARTAVDVQVAGRAGVPPDARAVVATVTAVRPAGVGNLRVYPAGSATPDISTVNYAPGQEKANAVVVGLADGKVSLYSDTASDSVEVVVDVTGYVPASGTGYAPVTPTRILDTRASASASLRPFGTMTSGTVTLDARRLGAVPAGARAVVLNATSVSPNSLGNLRVHATGAVPSGSSLNYIIGRDVPNLVIVPIGPDGRIALTDDQVGQGTTDVTLDVVGYLR